MKKAAKKGGSTWEKKLTSSKKTNAKLDNIIINYIAKKTLNFHIVSWCYPILSSIIMEVENTLILVIHQFLTSMILGGSVNCFILIVNVL